MSVQITTQTGQVDANAGLQQNVTINTGGDGTSSTPGPGIATPDEVAGGGTSSTSNTGTSSTTTPAWATYLVIAALAFFALKKMGGS